MTVVFVPQDFKIPGNVADVLEDQWSPGTLMQSVWSPGQVAIQGFDRNSFQPTDQSMVIALSFRLTLAIRTSLKAFGKFGKIIGGLILDAPGAPSVGQGVLAFNPITALPSDSSLVTTLWDPAIDPLPPVTDNFLQIPLNRQLHIAQTLTLPIPRQMYRGQQPAAQLWIEPMLQATYGPINGVLAMCVVTCAVTLVVDDGR